MNEPREYVLVVIPAFNQAQFLPEAIGSVLRQDYPFVKTVVVDDGSTDDTAEVCNRYVESNPERIFYRYQENKGCASARNFGLDLFVKDVSYVCFLDADDHFLPGKLSREVDLLRANPAVAFTYSDAIMHDQFTGKERLQKVAAAGEPEKFAIEHFLTDEAKSGALLYRTEVFLRCRFREETRFNEDSEFLQRVAIEYKGVYSSKPGCWVREHVGNKSRNRIEIFKAELASCQRILKSYPQFYRFFVKQADRRVDRLRKLLFTELVVQGRWDEAKRFAKTAIERWAVEHRLQRYWKIRRSFRSLKTRVRHGLSFRSGLK